MGTDVAIDDEQVTQQQGRDHIDLVLEENYPTLFEYASAIKAPQREIVGREYQISQLMAAMNRPELCNSLLLAPAGTGKTVLVQAVMLRDTDRLYLEVDVTRMIADVKTADQMAALLKTLFNEAETFTATEDVQLVLFMDEFHQIVQLSAASVEALKPVLAASGARGIRVIAATTFDEFHEHIRKNQPLVERLQRINVPSPDSETTVKILKGMAARYGVADQFYDDRIFELIYEYTERYIPASVQPRKSINVLDSMVGWSRLTGRPMDRALLADVLMESTGTNVAFRVDASRIKDQLDKKVLGQKFATTVVAKRLQLCVADLNDKTKPESSFLFTGSTGVGKFCADSTPVPVHSEDGSVAWKPHGSLVPGDRVFQRDGAVQDVLGVFPQGRQDIYRVTLWDDRTLDVGGPHLWSVYTAKMRSDKHAGKSVEPKVMTTLEMVEQGVVRSYPGDAREHLKFFIPANDAVQWPEQQLDVDPYVLGVFIGNGSLTQGPLTLSSDDAAVVHRVGEALGVVPKKKSAYDYSWLFPTGEKRGQQDKLAQTADFLAQTPDLIGAYSAQRRIPQQYMTGSIEQRWELVRGLFDTDGTIDSTSGRYNISYSTFSKGLAEDVRELLFSLGVSNTLNAHHRVREGRDMVEYDVHVKIGNEDKEQFFWLPRKRQLAAVAAEMTSDRQRMKKFDMIGISSIEKLDEQQSASCIYVSGDEHLYQAGQFVVTHNTELTKQLANLLFGDAQNHVLRFDMSEYSLEESVIAFKSELTRAVWNTGHAVLLLDEIEKASKSVTRMLLQVLDDGRLTDDHGRQVSFLNSYIVMTTNAASEIYKVIAQYNVDDEGSGKELREKTKEIRKSIETTSASFPAELLGRIDEIVPFQPLSRETQRRIVHSKLRSMVQEVLTKHGVRVQINERVLSYLIDDLVQTDSSAGGARDALSKMSHEVTTEVASFINHHPQEKVIAVDIRGGMRNEDKRTLKSSAYVEVSSRTSGGSGSRNGRPMR